MPPTPMPPPPGDAIYHCLVTATTVGYGDVSIQHDGGRMWAFFHIVISVSLLAAIVSTLWLQPAG